MKISRRALARVALAGAASARQAIPQPAAASDELEEARKQVAVNHQALLDYDVPMTAEPAFQFKA